MPMQARIDRRAEHSQPEAGKHQSVSWMFTRPVPMWVLIAALVVYAVYIGILSWCAGQGDRAVLIFGLLGGSPLWFLWCYKASRRWEKLFIFMTTGLFWGVIEFLALCTLMAYLKFG
jgi:hypothetical protein